MRERGRQGSREITWIRLPNSRAVNRNYRQDRSPHNLDEKEDPTVMTILISG